MANALLIDGPKPGMVVRIDADTEVVRVPVASPPFLSLGNGLPLPLPSYTAIEYRAVWYSLARESVVMTSEPTDAWMENPLAISAFARGTAEVPDRPKTAGYVGDLLNAGRIPEPEPVWGLGTGLEETAEALRTLGRTLGESWGQYRETQRRERRNDRLARPTGRRKVEF